MIRRLPAVSAFLCLAIVAGLVLNVKTTVAENLVKNPSFAKSSPKGTLPADWNGDSKVFAVDKSVTHNGRASLRYQNSDPKRYLLCTQKIAIRPGALIQLSGWVKTKDVAGEESGATFCLEWKDGAGKHLGGCYPDGIKGTQDWTKVEAVTRLPKNAATGVVSCYLRLNMTGTAWFDDVSVEHVKAPLLETALLAPNYRGRITAESPKEAAILVNLNLADHNLKPADVRLAAFLRDTSKRELAAKKDIVVSAPTKSSDIAEAKISLPIGNLATGVYDLEIQAVNQSGKVLAIANHRLERMAEDFKPRCAIDAHRRLLVDGRPFFPIGMYWSGINAKDLEVFAQSKFNCLMPYGSPSKEKMDLAWKHRLRVLYSVKDCYVGTHGCPKTVRTEADEEQWVRSKFKTFRDHPALLGWYLNDELSAKYMPRLNAHQTWAVEDDPNHPTWIVLCHPNEVGLYMNSCDAVGVDPYPIGRSPASQAAKWTAITFNQSNRCRAMWQVPQVFNWANYEKNSEAKQKCRTPTVDEIRGMTWQCIAEGATGIVFYSWYDMHRNPDVPFDTLWPALKKIVAEIDRFSQALLSIEPAPTVTVAQQPAWLHFIVRRHQGKLYLFAVNDGNGDGSVKLSFDSPIGQVREVRTNRVITAENAAFDDAFKPHQVAIYEIEPR